LTGGRATKQAPCRANPQNSWHLVCFLDFPRPLQQRSPNPLRKPSHIDKMAQAVTVYPPLGERPIANTICLFDVDLTLTIPRRVSNFHPSSSTSFLTLFQPQKVTPEMLAILHSLRQKMAIGYVGGSDLAKQQEQLGSPDVPVTTLFDFCFPENGLTAFKMGVPLASQSFIGWLGEPKYKDLVKFILHYIADLDIPVKRGTFVEFRNGMINVSPIGRNASVDERNEYQRYDLEHKIRETFVGILQEKFADLGLE
jgi:phosphomannomutase